MFIMRLFDNHALSPPAWEAGIEIPSKVAQKIGQKSPPAWEAGIEISQPLRLYGPFASPPAWEAGIEICLTRRERALYARRLPHGRRGLKSAYTLH